MLHTDPLGIAALKTVGDAERPAFALAPPEQKTLVPSAWRQLIPNERGNAARVAGRQPGGPVSARRALPPVSGHENPLSNRSRPAAILKNRRGRAAHLQLRVASSARAFRRRLRNGARRLRLTYAAG